MWIAISANSRSSQSSWQIRRTASAFSRTGASRRGTTNLGTTSANDADARRDEAFLAALAQELLQFRAGPKGRKISSA